MASTAPCAAPQTVRLGEGVIDARCNRLKASLASLRPPNGPLALRPVVGIAAALVMSAPAQATGSERVVISDVNVISMVPDRPATRATVVIRGARIDAVLPAGTDAWRLGDTLIRGRGAWLIPGLWDAAVGEVDAGDLRMMAYAGVTSVALIDKALLRQLEPLASFEPASLPALLDAASVARESDAVTGRRALDALHEPATALFDEMSALADGGWSNDAILEGFTRRAAEAFGRGDSGRVEPGAIADLILLTGDPRLDLEVLRTPRMIFLRGRPIYRSEMLSVAETLERLRAAERTPFAGFDAIPLGKWAIFHGAWRIDVDGLPRAALRVVVDRMDDEFTTTVQRSAWEPEWSRTQIWRREDAEGRLRGLRVAYQNRVGRETLELIMRAGRWVLDWTLDGESGSSDVPTAFLAGTIACVDPIPMPTDLRRLASGPLDQRRAGPRLTFGSEPTTVGRSSIRRVGKRDVSGPVALADARLAAAPEERVVIVSIGADEGDGPAWSSSLFLSLPPRFSATVAAFAVDAEGWMRRGILAVPEGVVEAHAIAFDTVVAAPE